MSIACLGILASDPRLKDPRVQAVMKQTGAQNRPCRRCQRPIVFSPPCYSRIDTGHYHAICDPCVLAENVEEGNKAILVMPAAGSTAVATAIDTAHQTN